MASITSRGGDCWEVAVGGGSNRTSRRVHGTYADALAVAAGMEASRGSAPQWAGVTLDAYFERVFIPARGDLEPSTIGNYRTIWRLHVSPAFGSRCISEPGHAEVQAWALSMSRGTSVHAVKLLRCVLRDAFYMGILPCEPMRRPVRYPKVHQGKLDVWDAQEALDALSRLHGHRLEPLVAVMLGGGLRRSEALALCWEDVSFSDGMARLAVRDLPEYGALINAVVLAGTMIYELSGPLITKFAQTKAGEIKPDTAKA